MNRFVIIMYHLMGMVLLPIISLSAGVHVLFRPNKLRMYLEKLSFVLPPSLDSSSTVVWIHAVSLGEVLSCEPLVRLLTDKNLIVRLSTGTQSGYEMVKKKYPYVKPFYFPFDFHFCVSRFLDRIKPHVILLCEMEIWPAFVWTAHRRKIPLYLISGRMVEKDFRRYYRFRWFFKPVFSLFTGIFMQNHIYLQRLMSISPHPRLKNLGSLKYDAIMPETFESNVSQLMPDGYNICAVSTHAGEEKFIVRAFKSLHRLFPKIRLILVPRHPERTREITHMLLRQEISFTLRSLNKPCSTSVFIVDSIGEMPGIYPKCQLVIMGGSFSQNVGGHNIIEPALYRKCIVCGHHMANFRDIYTLFKARGALVPARQQDLKEILAELFRDPKKAARTGDKAYELVLENKGACQRIYHEIFKTHNPKFSRRY